MFNQYIDVWKKTFIYRGTSPREEFTAWFIVGFLYSFALGFFAQVPFSMLGAVESESPIVPAIVFGGFLLLTFAPVVPSISLSVRRLRDANFSAWFALLWLVPFMGPIIIFIFMWLPSETPEWGNETVNYQNPA